MPCLYHAALSRASLRASWIQFIAHHDDLFTAEGLQLAPHGDLCPNGLMSAVSAQCRGRTYAAPGLVPASRLPELVLNRANIFVGKK
ncbi:MAG: hypothetical protein WKG07_47820 [Hymenobacter sp.]